MLRAVFSLLILTLGISCQSSPHGFDSDASMTMAEASVDERMEWWRDARFGMFIHWGLYSTLEGEWKGATGHAEWIRTTAQIPLEEYDKLQAEFNPVNYDAEAWCRMAKAAGMKYVVITTKHHDGFCLWPSDATEFDVAGGPSGRDLLAELAEACRRHGLKLGWYHSIMDWHHPDYLPRRGWETERSREGADFDRYVDYLHAQVTELLSNYGPIDVMWFDGEWENTWTSEYGRELYALCRELQPQVLVNNRVDKGRAGMAGLDKGPGFAGDFGTPEQEVPAGGLPGVDWETCMTMNRYWGWNRADTEWKSTGELIHTLVDVASKGGNFLLNIGPKPDGSFPVEAQERLAGMGAWMDAFGESIYATQASPFPAALEWGRATLRGEAGADESTLYLHVFDWPRTPQLIVPNLDGEILSAELLGTPEEYPLGWQKIEGGTQFFLPKLLPHPDANVVKVRFKGQPVVYRAPEIQAEIDRFVEAAEVAVTVGNGLRVHYSLDGSEPTLDSPEGPVRFELDQTTTVSARSFRDGRPVSEVVRREFVKLTPRAAVKLPSDASVGGLRALQWTGAVEQVPEPLFSSQTPTDLGRPGDLRMTEARRAENQSIEQSGWLHLPTTGLYQFALTSDDGSKLWIGDRIKDVVVDNDGLHGAATKVGYAALAKGWHPIRIVWFNRTGSGTLDLEFGLAGGPQQRPAPQGLAAN
jgi:alpha-L-fucosidase